MPPPLPPQSQGRRLWLGCRVSTLASPVRGKLMRTCTCRSHALLLRHL